MSDALQTADLAGRERVFFAVMAGAIAATIVASFGAWALRGYVVLPAPLLVHAHALMYMGWVGIFLTQTILIVRGSVDLHRRLGAFAALYASVMLVMGAAVALESVREARVPPFFVNSLFLGLSAMELLTFAGLTAAAVLLRRRSDWHKRLMLCGIIALMAPAWGRVLPMSALGPAGGFAIMGAQLGYISVGMGFDLITRGRIHPAYFWGAAAMVVLAVGTPFLGFSPLFVALAHLVEPH
ncbi:MAG: hypothetical protein R3C55_14865 [Parvularculaceae bacterium]